MALKALYLQGVENQALSSRGRRAVFNLHRLTEHCHRLSGSGAGSSAVATRDGCAEVCESRRLQLMAGAAGAHMLLVHRWQQRWCSPCACPPRAAVRRGRTRPPDDRTTRTGQQPRGSGRRRCQYERHSSLYRPAGSFGVAVRDERRGGRSESCVAVKLDYCIFRRHHTAELMDCPTWRL